MQVYSSSSQFPTAEVPEMFHKFLLLKESFVLGKKSNMEY